METIFWCFVALAFSSGLIIVDAKYCQPYSKKCCPYAGLKEPTCAGSGTTDIADLLAIANRNRTTYCVAGRYEDIYGVWGIDLLWNPGAQLVAKFRVIYAYIIEIPESCYTKHTYYIIYTTGCPRIYELKNTTTGNVEGTSDLPLNTVYRVCSQYNNFTYPAFCNTVAGNFFPEAVDPTSFALRDFLDVFLSSIATLRFKSLYGVDNYPLLVELAKANGLNVQQGECHCTFIQKDYPNGKNLTCLDPYPQAGIGRLLVEQKFDVSLKTLQKPGGLCYLSSYVSKVIASKPFPTLLSFSRVSIIGDPYLYVYQLNCLVQTDLIYWTFRPFISLC